MGKRFRVPALVVGGLVLAYLLFGWFAVGPLVQWAVPRWVAEKSAHQLRLEQVRFNPLALSMEIRGLALNEPDQRPLLAMDRLLVNVSASSLFRVAYVLDEVRLTAPRVQLELREDGSLNWLALLNAFKGPPQPADPADDDPPRLLLHRLVLEQGRVDLVDRQVSGGFQTRIEPLDLTLDHLSTLPDDRGDHVLSARSGIGAQLRWQGQLGLNPLRATGELALDELQLEQLWPYLKDRVRMAPPQGQAALKLAYQAGYADGVLDLRVEQIDLKLDKLALRGAQDKQPALAVDAVHLSGGRFDLGQRELAFEGVSVRGGRVALALDANGRPSLLDWLPPSPPAAPVPDAKAPQPVGRPWQLRLAKLGLERMAVQVVDHGFAVPLVADVGQLTLGLQAEARVGAGAPAVVVSGLAAQLSDLRLASGDASPWFELASLRVDDGRVDLSTREAGLGRLALSGGRLAAGRDAGGRIGLLEQLKRPGPPTPPAATTADKAWRYRVGQVEAADFELALRDETVSPPAQLTLQGLRAQASGLSGDPKAAVPVQLQFRVQQGGSFQARGQVVPAAPSADLQLTLADLSLLPAQPFVAKATSAVLAGGRASTRGRLRYRDGQLRYEGGVAVRDFALNEARTGERFLGWKSLSSGRVVATRERLDIGELLLDGLDAKLVIFQDRTVNVAQLMQPAGAPPPAPAASVPATPAAATKAPPRYRVAVQRTRISNGQMAFADLSLALPFGARIHELKGQLMGLSNAPGETTQLEFDGRVDEYGLARAAGQINLFDPTGFTDIKLVFSNVEMTQLTPYSATFAGRRIRSGKLSLDLEYKVKQRQLQGDNKVVMDKLTLGERVDSPSARSLPLDLAIALLEDANGRIDLGLPVSGSLDDPQFSYGGLIWKAIVNVVTKIVTSPFRALGAMLGVGGDALGELNFDAGRAELLPPEREKLVQVAKLMAQRPALGLGVPGVYSLEADGDAVKELRLRRAVAQQQGRVLAADEDPGPISTAQPATREALEKLYAQRFGKPALDELLQRHRQANPEAAPPTAGGRMLSRISSMFEGKREPLSADEIERLRGSDPHVLMGGRLLQEDRVDEARLQAIGRARAEAVRAELQARGVAPQRVQLQEPKAQPGAGLVVKLALALGAATPAEGDDRSPDLR